MLTVLGARHERRGEEVELLDRPVVFRVHTASTRGVVGFTCLLAIVDEGARLRDAETGANPAREILASLSPTLATTGGRLVFSSSPWGETDHHAELYARGEDEAQAVAYAPTWIANPTITEARTRALEPNPAVWSREYAAMPVASVTSIATKADLDAITRRGVTKLPRIPGARYVATLDAGLRNDAWVVCVWCLQLRRSPGGEIDPVVTQGALLHLQPSFLRKIVLEDAIKATTELLREYGATTVFADGHYADALSPKLAESGVTLKVMSMTSAAITARVEALQLRVQNGTIALLDHTAQEKELLQAQLVAHPGGRLTLRAPVRRGAHDDIVSAILLAVDAEAAPRLPPADGEILVRHAPVQFDRDAHSLSGGHPAYFRREGKALVPCEPPYGSSAFIAWAQDLIASGGTTDSIQKWARELGIEVVPGMDPALLDPRQRET
jgi:hypothetical protein